VNEDTNNIISTIQAVNVICFQNPIKCHEISITASSNRVKLFQVEALKEKKIEGYYKIIDKDSNFIYLDRIKKGQVKRYSVYAYGDVSYDELEAECSNDCIDASFDNESGLLSVRLVTEKVYKDTFVCLRNKRNGDEDYLCFGDDNRLWIKTAQLVEQLLDFNIRIINRCRFFVLKKIWLRALFKEREL
jgi:hypothetical protein